MAAITRKIVDERKNEMEKINKKGDKKMKLSKTKIGFTEKEILIITALAKNAEKGNDASNISYMEFGTSKYWVDRLLELMYYIPVQKLYLNLLYIAHERKNELEKINKKGVKK